mmetsp:Transcript_16174/g.31284  ORF Transcript_16174/g.31284 Transcript_16174/m.31284 type:complete len:285 (-) Transcript_16174:271-1125(-)
MSQEESLATPLLTEAGFPDSEVHNVEDDDVHLLQNIRSGHELRLLKHKAPKLVASVAYLVYFGVVVFRNLAFLRVDLNPEIRRLPDVGMDLLPLIETWWSTITCEVCFWLVQLSMLALLWSASRHPQSPEGKNKPFAAELLETFVFMLIVGHTLRFLTYISTSMPGPGHACLDSDFTDTRPKTAFDVFLGRFSWEVEQNCGDLLFSGRIYQCLVVFLIVHRHGRSVFEYSSCSHFICLLAVALCTFVLALSMLLRRNTYTGDILLAIYTAPLLYHYVTRELKFV